MEDRTGKGFSLNVNDPSNNHDRVARRMADKQLGGKHTTSRTQIFHIYESQHVCNSSEVFLLHLGWKITDQSL